MLTILVSFRDPVTANVVRDSFACEDWQVLQCGALALYGTIVYTRGADGAPTHWCGGALLRAFAPGQWLAVSLVSPEPGK